MPLVETRYRIRADRDHRAIAGLSMGGAETLRVAPSHLDLFSHIGVFSMGLQVGMDGGVNTDFEERNAGFFADPAETNARLNGITCSIKTEIVSGPSLTGTIPSAITGKER
jgi:enterochelin esterase family protein